MKELEIFKNEMESLTWEDLNSVAVGLYLKGDRERLEIVLKIKAQKFNDKEDKRKC